MADSSLDPPRLPEFGHLDPADTSPLYIKVQRAIRQAIDGLGPSAGMSLPAERDLADAFGVSRVTVRKALAGLSEAGLLDRRHGSGTFVAQAGRIEKSLSRITSFSEDMIARNHHPRSEWIDRTAGIVSAEEALALGLSPGAGVYRFLRIRYADDLPMALESAIVPATCLPSADAVQASLYEALDSQGYRPVRALQRLRAINLDAGRAARLGLAPGAAALLIERRGFAADGKPVEITTSWYRGDAYDFLAELGG